MEGMEVENWEMEDSDLGGWGNDTEQCDQFED